MLRFLKDEDGATAIIFALALLPLLGSAGVAIDYGRAMEFREFARQQGDAAAVAVGAAQPYGGVASDADAIAAAKAAIEGKYGSQISGLNVSGSWDGGTNYRLVVGADLKNSILAAVPGMPDSTRVEVETIINLNRGSLVPLKPKTAQLSHEAADYNRIYMYCYNHQRRTEADKGRSKFVAIADNADARTIEAYATANPDLNLFYAKNEPPACGKGEVVSYMLRNVRVARTDTSKWDNENVDVYKYYTDTRYNTPQDELDKILTLAMSGERIPAKSPPPKNPKKNEPTSTPSPEAIDMVKNPMLETIICTGDSECQEKRYGGILPNEGGKNRTPAVATGVACNENQAMYFGWEDRRPAVDGSDRDYDDIRIIVDCPRWGHAGDKVVRIIK